MSHAMITCFPFGVFSIGKQKKHLATRFKDQIVDLYGLAEAGHFADLRIPNAVFRKDYLNDFISLGKAKTNALRTRLVELFAQPNPDLQAFLHPADAVELHLPIKIGDYTDFYSSEQHAFNVGVMFRDPANALLPNWKHLPVGYHGRASSIVVSGTHFHRPKGQINASDTTLPSFSPTQRLDIELEMATIIGKGNPIGEPIPVDEAEEHVFGFALFNDWSARDIQRWEYVPLGPFLAKNFFSSLAPWVIPIEDLEPFRVPAEKQNPAVLTYLQEKKRRNFDVHLEVYLQPEGAEAVKIIHSNFKYLYWTVAQQIAHHTVNGCNLNVGDVLASGTISGKTPDSFGSLLELSWGGKNPLHLPDGSTRSFLEDGDVVIIKGYAEKGDLRVDFGEIRTKILPARP
jgi:fumarylacetoacetase